MPESKIQDNETLIRYIHHNYITEYGNISEHSLMLRHLPSGKDEKYLSVSRLGYQGYKPSKDKSPNRNYVGYLSLLTLDCRKLSDISPIKLEIKPMPSKDNSAHAGIYFYSKNTLIEGEYEDEDYKEFLSDLIDLGNYISF